MSAGDWADIAAVAVFMLFLAFVARVMFRSLREDPEVAKLRAEVAALREEIRGSRPTH